MWSFCVFPITINLTNIKMSCQDNNSKILKDSPENFLEMLRECLYTLNSYYLLLVF